jgi:hypothetical protein
MKALVFWMPIPTYAKNAEFHVDYKNINLFSEEPCYLASYPTLQTLAFPKLEAAKV